MRSCNFLFCSMVTTSIILDKLFNYNKIGTPSDLPKWETKQTFLGKLKFYQVFLPVKNTSIELFHHLLEKKMAFHVTPLKPKMRNPVILLSPQFKQPYFIFLHLTYHRIISEMACIQWFKSHICCLQRRKIFFTGEIW